MKGLHAYVYRSAGQDCTNHGLTEKANNITIVGDGIPEIFEANDKTPAFKVVRRVIFGEQYLHLEPVNPPPAGWIGWMNGGNVADSSDSRFPAKYPLRIHDRAESPELYDRMSM